MNTGTEQIFLINPSSSQSSSLLQKVGEIAGAGQVNLENVEDFSSVCRTCATITEFVIPIFSGEGLQNNLADKIHKHLPIQVSEEDSLPRAVCCQCAHTLLAWHELVACCRQADQALRTRLQQIQRAQDPRPNETTSNEDDQTENPQKEFEKIVVLVEPLAKDPPEYHATTSPVPVELITCTYCHTQHPTDIYKEHLLQVHTDLLFHCDECNDYIDRKDFIVHMSYHVAQYSFVKKEEETKKVEVKKPIKKKKKVKEENENNNKKSEKNKKLGESHSKVDKIANSAANKICKCEVRSVSEAKTNNEHNDFSDQSDTEFGFGPLPESVFEAIEDSQDSQTGNEPTNALDANDDDISEKEIEISHENKELQIRKKNPFEKNSEKKRKRRTCPICSKTYTAASSYFYHMKTSHKKTRDHECEMCGQKFWTKVVLNQHMSTHNDARENECTVCGKKVKTKASLYIHMQTHVGNKKFSCDQCQVSFRWRTHLKRHLERHAADKSHVCTTCNKGFTIRCDLLRHIRTHSAGKHECKKCGVSFAQARYLKAHAVKKHSTKDN